MKEIFCRCSLVLVTARWRKDTGENILSLRRTIYSRHVFAVYVKGKFVGTYSKKCTNRAAAPLSVYAERITALATVFHFFS
jgi:hypothetical protein